MRATVRTMILAMCLFAVSSGTTYSQQPDSTDTLVDKLLGTNEESSDSKTQEIINQLRNNRIPKSESTPQEPTAVVEPKPVKEMAFRVKKSDADGQDLRDTISRYLVWHKETYKTPGVGLLEPRHLDTSLLKFRPISQGEELRVQVLFDEAFRNHVAVRGRRHLLKRRLPETTFALLAIVATLVLLYGVLKVVNSRSKQRDDFISTSQVPMV